MLTAVVILAVVPDARGQQGDVEAARAAAERGRREYNLGHWQQSIEGFEKAYQLSGDAAFLFNLGQAHRQLGHSGEALRLYRTYLRERPDASNRDVAEKQIKELEAQEGRAPGAAKPAPSPTAPAALTAKPAAPPTAPPPQAAKPAPAAATAPPAQAAKPAPAPTAATAPPPQAAKPAATPGAPPPQTAQPATAPAAAAAPALAGTAPSATPAPAATAPGAIVVAPAAPPPPRDTPLPKWLPLAGVVLTAATAATATVVGLQASSRYDDLKASCGQTAAGCAADQIDGVKSRDRTATILWISAGVLAAATGVAIVVNAHAAGASALWRF